MPLFLTWLGWLLIAGAAALLILSHFIEGSFFDPLKNALPAGVLVALAANLLTQAKNATDSVEKRSLFNLESSIKAYEQAKSLIENGNNDRAKWIEAGRCLEHAKALGAGVTFDAHQRVLEFNRLKYRSFFYELLKSRPGAFFYGTSDPSLPLEEAARASTEPEERNGRMEASALRELAESSIRAVWEAAQWPQDYKDPLGEHFTESERDELIVMFLGLHQYLNHRQQWHSRSGQLHPRKKRHES